MAMVARSERSHQKGLSGGNVSSSPPRTVTVYETMIDQGSVSARSNSLSPPHHLCTIPGPVGAVHRAVLGTVVLCVCLAPSVIAAETSPNEPEIVELYPNPAAPNDSGEFVTVHAPAGTNLSRYELADDQTEVHLSTNGTLTESSTVTFSTDPERTESLTNRTVHPLPDGIRMANDGERLRLLRNGSSVDEVQYDRAPEGNVYAVDDRAWRPLGWTARPVVRDGGGTVETFVLPDESTRAVEFLETASERILLAGYTLSSQRVVDALVAAHERGVTVEVLVDGTPVGGVTDDQVNALDAIANAGVSVDVLAGELTRFRFHHAKYAIVDDRALVTTENWKESGLGGNSSRGWAVITDQAGIVDELARTYRADTEWVDTRPWTEFEVTETVQNNDSRRSYPTNFDPAEFSVERTELLLAPDNMEERALETIASATESIDIKQVRIGDRQFPLLQAAIDAAERGVEVRILLSGAWYVEEENRRLERWLDDQAEAAGLPLSVRISRPGGDYEKIHAKGMLVDGDRTLLGSANWNNNSLRNNREVGLLVESEQVGTYFERVFEHDWERDGGDELPLGYLIACLVGAIVALLAGRRLEFEE